MLVQGRKERRESEGGEEGGRPVLFHSDRAGGETEENECGQIG